MKKLLLIPALFAAIVLNAQIVNNDFEIWETDTVFFPGSSGIPPDTFPAFNPAGWTSSNSLTEADSLGGVSFVTQSGNAYSGSSAVQMVTDSVQLPVGLGIAFKLTIPGFVLNGSFPITPESLIGGGNVISPMAIAGAGQPFTQRLGKIKGYYNYAPVGNPNTNVPDTCLVWATLRKGNIAVANAVFKSIASTNGNYQPFEASFVYENCETPDTLVILMASSVPNIAQIIGGSSGLVPGSTLLVDSIYYEELGANFDFTPIVRNDIDTTTKNNAKNILVKANDEDCDDSNASLTISIVQAPVNGTATVGAGNAFVTYTPNTDYVGLDTFTYTLSDGANTSTTARVRVLVLQGTNINETELADVKVYPVPANDVLNVMVDYNTAAVATVYDAVGRVVSRTEVANGNVQINTSALGNGIYSLTVTDTKGKLVARTKFSISK